MENNEKYRKTVLTGIYPFMWVKMPNTSREMMIYGGKRLNSTCFTAFLQEKKDISREISILLEFQIANYGGGHRDPSSFK